MKPSDRFLEARISAQAARLDTAMKWGGVKAARDELDKLEAMIAQRTPEAIAELERRKGLSRG